MLQTPTSSSKVGALVHKKYPSPPEEANLNASSDRSTFYQQRVAQHRSQQDTIRLMDQANASFHELEDKYLDTLKALRQLQLKHSHLQQQYEALERDSFQLNANRSTYWR